MIDGEFKIVPVDSANAGDVGGVFPSVYGDGFPVKDVYDSAVLAREIAAGRVTAFLAFDRQGQPAGYVSLFKSAPNPRLWEAGNLMSILPINSPAWRLACLNGISARKFLRMTAVTVSSAKRCATTTLHKSVP